MRKDIFRSWNLYEAVLAAISLVVLLVYTYGLLVVAPYSGFYFNPSNGQVIYLYLTPTPADGLQLGDRIESIGDVSWSSYKADAEQTFLSDAQSGDVVQITVIRDGNRVVVPWKFPGFNWNEFWNRLPNLWLIAYVFWFFGMVTQLFVRPKDVRWRLMAVASYFTSLWLIFGSLSLWQMWMGSSLFHAVTWIVLPLYLHLHWEFPRPVKKSPAVVWIAIYSAGFVLAALEMFHLLPRSAYFFGVLLMFSGSIFLLFLHFLKQPTHRRDIGFLLVVIVLSFLPMISLSVAGVVGSMPANSPLALLSLPIMPAAYFYIIYRRQLGGLELRANRLLAIYSFLILFVTIMLPIIASATVAVRTRGTITIVTLAFTVLSVMTGILLYPRFQIFVEQRLLGIKLPLRNLLEIYSTRITTSTSLPSLLRLLQDEVIPSLLVRQFAFFQAQNGSSKALLSIGLDENDVPGHLAFSSLMSISEKYRLPDEVDRPSIPAWIRLVLPLRLGEDVIGFWLLGRRDPDDIYLQADVSILQSLANQTAIALSNILQTERLTAMYQADINRYEEERLRLALDLHDSILNQMAALLMIMDDNCLTPAFQESYDGLTHRLREIVSDLRPPMLNYGLKAALDDLAANLVERSKNELSVVVDMDVWDLRYHPNVELHLFRILQEACENVLRHADARNIIISGRLKTDEIRLQLEDDGVGFDTSKGVDLDTLLAQKHFGLVGMIERAMLISADVSFHSTPSSGTKIQIVWKDAPVEVE
jgi:signal transduction histidine kinase